MSPSASVMPAGGMSTLSMTWMTPLDAVTSAVVTFASLTMTSPFVTVKERSSPLSACAVIPSVTSEAVTEAKTTWYRRMSLRVEFSSSVSNVDRSIPAAANASSVGAKTVYGPSCCRAPTSPACIRASTRMS